MWMDQHSSSSSLPKHWPLILLCHLLGSPGLALPYNCTPSKGNRKAFSWDCCLFGCLAACQNACQSRCTCRFLLSVPRQHLL